MRRMLCINIISLIFGLTSLSASGTFVNYRGWDSCYQIKNDIAEIIICPKAGGRIIHYALKGKNVLYENPNFNGTLLSQYQKRRNVWADAGRFDYGPLTNPGKMRDELFMGEWKVIEADDYQVIIQSNDKNEVGIIATRSYHLNKRSTELIIKQSMTNITNHNIKVHFWNRTFCPAGGDVIMPYNKRRDKCGVMGMNSIENGNLKTENNILIYKTGIDVTKIGSDSRKGYISYIKDNLKFSQYFKVDKGDYTTTEDYTTIFYCNDTVCELEPVAPLKELKPKGKCSFVQRWIIDEKQ